MTASWSCSVCGHANPAGQVACEQASRHDEAIAVRAQAMRNAGQILADARARIARMTPEEAARAAEPNATPERLQELADKVRRMRAACQDAA